MDDMDYIYIWYNYWLVVDLPLWKNDGLRQLGWWNSQLFLESHKSHVPNHQPDIVGSVHSPFRSCVTEKPPWWDFTICVASLLPKGSKLCIPMMHHVYYNSQSTKKTLKKLWGLHPLLTRWARCEVDIIPMTYTQKGTP